MKTYISYIVLMLSAIFFLHACGEIEQPQPEVDQQAVQDSPSNKFTNRKWNRCGRIALHKREKIA